MKAVAITQYVGSIASLVVSSIPSPEPKFNELLVQITHSGLNHVDLLYARGLHQNNHSGLVSPPFVLGLEFAGIVLSSPTDSRFAVGDKVWGAAQGGFAERICVPESAVQKLPRGWTPAHAAGVGAATAPVSYGALVRVAELKAGETVLVHAAAGGLGVVACQIGKALGARVIGTVGSEGKAEVMRGLGADVVRYDREGWEKEILNMTKGQGVDVVYDTVGLVQKSIRCLRFGGRVVVAGFAGLEGKMEEVAMNRVLLKGAKVLGYVSIAFRYITQANMKQRFGESGRRDPKETPAIWKGLNEMLERNEISPIVYKTYQGLEAVPTAMQELADRKVYGKAVVHISDEEASQSKL